MHILWFITGFICLGFISSADAQRLPTLAAVETPNFSAGMIPDPTFPTALERDGDLTYALLEWKRIAHSAIMDADIERARFNIARLTYTLGDKESAAIDFEAFGKAFPTSSFIPESLYYMSRIWDEIDPPMGGKVYRAKLLADYTENEFTEKAYYHYLWGRALQGDDLLTLEHIDSIPSGRGIELVEQLKSYPVEKNEHVWAATGLAVIPGMGHAYLNDRYSAAIACIISLILLSAMFYCMKYKLWSFGFFFAMIGLTFYSGTIFSAHSLALRSLLEERHNAMKRWQDLHPDYDWLTGLYEKHALNIQDIPLFLYRNGPGTVDGEQANGSPVNSLYARQAIEKHGLLIGSWFAVDRLVRDWRESAFPLDTVYQDGRWRYVDPLSRNDFWLES